MVFNKKKFNFLVVLTVLLIAVVFGFSAIGVLAVEKDSLAQVEGEEDQTGNEGTTDVEEDFGNSEESSGDTTNQDGEENATQETQFKEVATFRTAKAALACALGLLKTNNYTIDFEQSVVAGAAGINGTQKISKDIYVIDGVAYVKSVADGKDVPMNYGENYTEYVKVDANNIIINRDGAMSTQSASSYSSTYGLLPNEIPYQFDLSASASFGKKTNYYEIVKTLTPKEYSKYKKSLAINGGEGSDPKISSIEVTIRINKTYGYIESITATEKYTIKRAGMEASATSKISMKFSYSTVNLSKIEEIENKLK